jgi:hypothetical protein
MKPSWTLSVLALFAVVISGCNGSSNQPSSSGGSHASEHAASRAQAEPEVSPSVTVDFSEMCAKDPSFTPDASLPQVGPLVLGEQLNGNFELTTLHVYEVATDSNGNQVGVVSAGGTSMAPDDSTDMSFQGLCSAGSSAFTSGGSIPLIRDLHLPSDRVTVFDEGSRLDDPTFNYPTDSNFTYDSEGREAYQLAIDGMGPPYNHDLYFRDYLSRMPATPAADVLADGSFELRFHWQDKGSTETLTYDVYMRFEKIAQKR